MDGITALLALEDIDRSSKIGLGSKQEEFHAMSLHSMSKLDMLALSIK